MRESPNHTLKLTEKARKIATPPSRGRGDSWIWRPCCGRETHPRRVAMSRTWRVATNDTANENANIPKNRSVKPQFPFRLKHPAFQARVCKTICVRRSFLTKRRRLVIFDCRNYTSSGLRWANVSRSRMTSMPPWTADVRAFGPWSESRRVPRVPTRVLSATHEREQFGNDASMKVTALSSFSFWAHDWCTRRRVPFRSR